MRKSTLSIIGLVANIISLFLLYIDGLFVWGYVNSYGTNTYLPESFNWLFDTQYDTAIVVWFVMALIIINIIIHTFPLFKKFSFCENKYMTLLPVATLIVFVLCCIWGESNIGNFVPNYNMLSHMERPWVDFGIIFYVEVVLLGISILVEALKHFSKISE